MNNSPAIYYASMHSVLMNAGDWYCQCQLSMHQQLSAKLFKLSFHYLRMHIAQKVAIC